MERAQRPGAWLVTIAALGFVVVPYIGAAAADHFDVIRDVTSELGATDSDTGFMNPLWIGLAVVLGVGALLARPVPLPWALLAGLAFSASYVGSAAFPCASVECDEASDLQSLHGLMTGFDVLTGLCFGLAVLLPLAHRRPDRSGLILFGIYVLAWLVGGLTFLVAGWFGLYQRIAELAFLAWLSRAARRAVDAADRSTVATTLERGG